MSDDLDGLSRSELWKIAESEGINPMGDPGGGAFQDSALCIRIRATRAERKLAAAVSNRSVLPSWIAATAAIIAAVVSILAWLYPRS